MVLSPVAPSRMLWALISLVLFTEKFQGSNGIIMEISCRNWNSPSLLNPYCGLGKVLSWCAPQTIYEMLHSAEIYEASHNDTLAHSHGERLLRLEAVIPSQLVSHTCYVCVVRDHSGILLAKEDLCVEVVAKDDPVIAITQHMGNVTFDLNGPSNNFSTTLVVTVPQIGLHNVSVRPFLTPTTGIRVSLLEVYHSVNLDTKLMLPDGSVSFSIHFELEPLKEILIRNIVEELQWKVSLYNYISCVQTRISVIAHSGSFSGSGNENPDPNSQGDAPLNAVLTATVTVILLSTFAIIVGIAIIARNLYLVRQYRKQLGLVQSLASTVQSPSKFCGSNTTDDHATLTQCEEEGL